MSSTAMLVARMAQTLAGAGVNLGDERACIRALQSQNFNYSDIVLFGDRAAKAAPQNILIVDTSKTENAHVYAVDVSRADIVIRDGFVVKDRDGIFAGVSR